MFNNVIIVPVIYNQDTSWLDQLVEVVDSQFMGLLEIADDEYLNVCTVKYVNYHTACR